MKRWENSFQSAAAVIVVLLSGCADFRQKAVHSSGLIDFATELSSHRQREPYPIERISHGNGMIVSAHVRKDARGLFVFGDVEKGFDSGPVSAAWSHVDVVVLDANGRVRCKLSTSFSPAVIPNTLRGITGRSEYIARLPFVPAEGSTIKVIFQPGRILADG